MSPPNPLFLVGEKLTAERLQALADDVDDWTPVLTASTTAPDLGPSPTQNGLIHLNGRLVTLFFDLTFSSSGVSAGSGTYRVELPAAYPYAAGFPAGAIGTAYMNDASATPDMVHCLADTVNGVFHFRRSSNNNLVTSSSPWTWNVNDAIRGQVRYLTDFT